MGRSLPQGLAPQSHARMPGQAERHRDSWRIEPWPLAPQAVESERAHGQRPSPGDRHSGGCCLPLLPSFHLSRLRQSGVSYPICYDFAPRRPGCVDASGHRIGNTPSGPSARSGSLGWSLPFGCRVCPTLCHVAPLESLQCPVGTAFCAAGQLGADTGQWVAAVRASVQEPFVSLGDTLCAGGVRTSGL